MVPLPDHNRRTSLNFAVPAVREAGPQGLVEESKALLGNQLAAGNAFGYGSHLVVYGPG